MKISKDTLRRIGKEYTWKHIISVFNACDALRVYRMTFIYLLEQKNHNFKEIVLENKTIPKEEKRHFPVGDYIQIGEVSVGIQFLLSLNVMNFFQTARNCFDYVSHVINEINIDNGFRINMVDFDKLYKRNDRITNDQLRDIVRETVRSDAYKYITDYNNTTKHNFDIGVRESVEVATLNISSKIPAFSKEQRNGNIHEYDTQDTIEKLEETYQFVTDVMERIMNTVAEGINGK